MKTNPKGKSKIKFILVAVVKKKFSKIILVQVYIIFALPDYSSEVIERHQHLLHGRLINLALEFDIH